MSADNCIAILATKIYPDSKEYQEWRVCIAHAIQNVYKHDDYMLKYFKNARVFDVFGEALLYAQKLELEYGPTEHGIIVVRHPLGRTWDEVSQRKTYVKKSQKNKRK